MWLNEFTYFTDFWLFRGWNAESMTVTMHRWRQEVKREKYDSKNVRKKWRVGSERPAVKERNVPVPQLLLESASVTTAYLTTGTVYFQKTVICGHRNLELGPLQNETGTIKYKTNIKMMYQEDVTPGSPSPLDCSGTVWYQVDRIYCRPALSLCQLAVFSEMVQSLPHIDSGPGWQMAVQE